MGTTLITNGYVVSVDGDRNVFTNGFVRIEDDSITAIGEMSELATEDRSADDTFDAHGMLVMPGLINGHNHHWGSLVKNTGEGLLLEDWIDTIAFPLVQQLDDDALRIASYLGNLEMIRTGTTCSLNHLFNINDHDSVKAIIEPVLEMGMRQLVGKECRHTPDPPFSDLYPAVPHVRNLDEELELAEELVDRWEGAEGVVHIGLAIETGANWLLHNQTSIDLIHAGHDLARRRDLQITNHCGAGTWWRSIKDAILLTGGGDIDLLAREGVLDDHWVLIHDLWISERELKLASEAGVNMVINPASEAYSADGVPPLKRILAYPGINVGLGSDGAYVNCSVDMVEQMKFTALIENVTHYDPTLVSSERAIEMATINCAKALGLDDKIGSLEVGKRADIAIFDLEKSHIAVGHRPVGALVFSSHGTDCDSLMVNGQFLMRNTELAFDREMEVLKEAKIIADRMLSGAGLYDRANVPWNKTS